MTARSSRATLGAIVAVLGVTACAEPAYIYEPETANTQASSGLPAARIDIPQERPTGSVQLTSYGVTRLAADGRGTPALHVRMTVANDRDQSPWTVDTRQVLVSIPGEGQSRPIFASSDLHTLPVIAIGEHERHVVDLYYPLPATVRGDRMLPRFDLHWEVATPTRQVASSTHFDRVSIETNYADAYPYGPYYYYAGAWPLWAGAGPYWWYDPRIQGGVVGRR
jgi:hypothetical protein